MKLIKILECGYDIDNRPYYEIAIPEDCEFSKIYYCSSDEITADNNIKNANTFLDVEYIVDDVVYKTSSCEIDNIKYDIYRTIGDYEDSYEHKILFIAIDIKFKDGIDKSKYE